MGIRGLLTFLRRNAHAEAQDLAVGHEGLTLILDVSAFVFWISETFLDADLLLTNCDYTRAHTLVTCFVSAVRSFGITLVACTDGVSAVVGRSCKCQERPSATDLLFFLTGRGRRGAAILFPCANIWHQHWGAGSL